MKKKIGYIANLLCFVILLFITSCVDGYKDDYEYASDVRNATLESPKAEDVSFVASPDGETVTISWPVVHGAGGYLVSFYNVDDPDNPVAIGTENEVIDGCSITREIEEDTKYRLDIKTLGNEKYNNKEALSEESISYSTLLPTYAVIPSGTDLSTYFSANPIPQSETELAYDLESGGSYTMSGDLPLGLTNVTIRGDKVYHPTVKMTTGAFLTDGFGLKIKFIDFDCTDFSKNAFITYNTTLNPALVASDWVCVTSPVVVSNCNISALPKPLLFDSSKKYAIQTLLVKNCVISMSAAGQRFLYMPGGIIKDLTIDSSTIYYTEPASTYFIQYNSNRITAVAAWGWISGGIKLANSTFWQVAKTGQMGNYAGLAQKGNYLTVQKCIFVDCGSGEVIRRLGGGNSNFTCSFSYNSYWFNGSFATQELVTTPKDNSGSHIATDPQLQDPNNGNFTVQGAAQIAARTGDPRWLPAQ